MTVYYRFDKYYSGHGQLVEYKYCLLHLQIFDVCCEEPLFGRLSFLYWRRHRFECKDIFLTIWCSFLVRKLEQTYVFVFFESYCAFLQQGILQDFPFPPNSIFVIKVWYCLLYVHHSFFHVNVYYSQCWLPCFIALGLVFMYGKRLHHWSRETGGRWKLFMVKNSSA